MNVRVAGFILHPSSFILHPCFISSLLHYLNKMRDLGNHPACFFRVHPFGDTMHLAEAEGFERFAHRARATDAAADLANANRDLLLRLLGRAHASPSVGVPV